MSAQDISIALAGNPNSGKTSMFNALTGARQRVGNFPGVTVERKEGTANLNGHTFNVTDLPGTYSLTAYSPEELVARNYVIDQRPDVVVDVVDASNLERNLYLAVQFMELGVPLVIALNMIDVAEAKGMKIDADRLSQKLGIPIVPTVARSGRGIEELLRAVAKVAEKDSVWRPLEISYGPDIDQTLADVLSEIDWQAHNWGLVSPRWMVIKALEGDQEIMTKIQAEPDLSSKVMVPVKKVEDHLQKTLEAYPEGIIAEHRYGFVSAATKDTVLRSVEERLNISDKIDKVLLNRVLGPAFLLGLLYVTYEFVFTFSEAPVGWLEAFFGWLSGAAEAALPDGLVRSLVVSGIIDGVGGVLGFAPLILFMFFAIAIMEDSGYLARVAYLLDRVLRAFGLHGNSVMAMIVSGGISGGCAVPGVMAARTIKDPRARLATILTVPMMNCGAKLPVYALLIAAFFAEQEARMLFILTLISWGLVLGVAFILRKTLLKGDQTPFVMELPPYRMPTLKGLLIHTWERTWQYIKKAGTVILAVSVVMWALMTFPGLNHEEAGQWEARIAAAETEEVKAGLEVQRGEAELKNTLAGRLGTALETVMAPMEFDWRTNVALVGGFAAKEVVVATMGTAYSLGEVDPEEFGGLSEYLGKAAGWTPLKAFALIVFVMIYAPCFVTVVMIRRESGSWKWALISMVYTTGLAYLLATVVYQGGKALGLG